MLEPFRFYNTVLQKRPLSCRTHTHTHNSGTAARGGKVHQKAKTPHKHGTGHGMQTSHQPFLQKKRLALPRRPRLAPDEKKKASREPPGCNFHEPCKCSGLHGTESERRLVPTYAFVTQSPLHTTRTLHKRHSVHRRNDDRIT